MRRLLLPLCVCLLAATAAARVISYAPYSDRLCMPAVQHRGARHFALVEFPNNGVYTYGQVVLYDTKGIEEPRVVYPVGGGYSTIFAAAVREDDQQLAILLQTDYAKFVLSVDGGNSWKSLANVYIYNALMSPYRDVTDAGGPYVRARHGRVRVGTRDVPFILDSGAGVVYAISANGTSSWIFSGRLVGTSRDGATLLVNSSYFLGTIDLISGKGRFLGYLPILGQSVEGWITPAGNAYVEIYNGDSDTGIYYFDGAETFLAGNTDYSPTTVFPNVPPIRRGGTYFAVPTADYSGAWLIARTNATTLSLHTAAKGLVKQWDDFTAPEVEALHPGSSGKTVLVQVHRPRVTLDQSLFKDPALAVWNGGGVAAAESPTTTVALRPREVRLVNDVLHALFGVESGGGALYITPDVGTAINVASRTYSQSDKGSYGFAMNGIDVFAAIGPRFPATFSAAVLGPNFRTNLTLTDVSGRATEAAVTAWLPLGATRDGSVAAPTLGQQQVNFLNDALRVPRDMSAALVVQPTRGEAIASVFAIDNLTNDATFFPPDISASVVRMIPVIGHVDGANGTQYRSDLFIFNNSASQKFVNVQATMWDGSPTATQVYPLTAHEVRVVPDVLFTLWKRTGIARMRVWSSGAANDPSVRVTSRTYTTDANGGTYGFLMPPLNSFQSGSAGDTLEILGASLQRRFRTNVGLVDVTRCDKCGVKSHARIDIIDHGGATIDSFETDVPAAGGLQMNDLLHARGLPDANTPVLIRITVIRGMLGAYAAVIDNGTNDPAYYAANLASKQ